MDFHFVLAAAAGLLAACTVLPYIRDMLRGTTRPNLVSWGLWLLIQGIFAAAQFTAGASFSIVLPLVGILAVLAVVILGLFGYGYKKYGPLDFVCLALALGAIVGWQLTSDPMVALILSVAADFIATVPTMFKAYRDPKSETPSAYVLAMLAATAGAFSSVIIDLPNLLWPAYMFAANALVLTLILLGRRGKRRG